MSFANMLVIKRIKLMISFALLWSISHRAQVKEGRILIHLSEALL